MNEVSIPGGGFFYIPSVASRRSERLTKPYIRWVSGPSTRA